MSGLVKAKKYDWKDSNLALFGSDTEKQVKKESAEAEPAWQGVGQEVGLKIWRIVKFEVTDWPEEDYGDFFSGDSYIILNTYKPNEDSEELAYDVHFWIGKYSTQDEYGTAAYKTVELDTYLDDKAIQHREVMGHESELFRSYFPNGIVIMEGGAESGFRHVTPEEYKKRLLHFSRKGKTVTMVEVPCSRKRLTSGDVFILDAGNKIYQWNGAESNKDERFQARMYVQKLKDQRSADDEVIDEDGSESHEFYSMLDEEDEEEEDEVDAPPEDTDPSSYELYKASDESGHLEFSKVKEGEITIDDFVSDDVFMLNTGKELFVWVGSGASINEKRNSMGYAHAHLAKRNQCLLPICVLKEGQHVPSFNAAVGLAA